jgi:thymidylate synthase
MGCYDYECAPRGQKIREKLGIKFEITDPRQRILCIPQRKFSVQYMIAEFLWYLSGNDSTEWISTYSSFWKKISDDGKTANSAYGARIFKSHPRIAGSQLIQWNHTIEELKKDPDSRRAIIHIKSPWDSVQAKLDVPCTLALQFFVRNGKVDLVVNMRSSDLILGIAYDIPAFTFLQELMALELGLDVGRYIHISNSLHIYEKHFGMVEKFLQPAEMQESRLRQVSSGKFPKLLELPKIKELMLFEEALQNAQGYEDVCNIVNELSTMKCNDINYWLDWGKILASHRLMKLELKDKAKIMQNSTSYVGYHQRGK